MATRYAGKYRHSPYQYPQATRTGIKTFNFSRYLSQRGTFWHPPRQIFFLCWEGQLSLLGGTSPSTSHTGLTIFLTPTGTFQNLLFQKFCIMIGVAVYFTTNKIYP